MNPRSYDRPAKGHVDPTRPTARRILIAFEVDVFEELRDQAVTRRQSFGARVRDLVEYALWAEESGHRPPSPPATST